MALYVVKSLDLLKNLNEGSDSFYVINVNEWFESHGFSHKDMNPVREWIFVEWMNKKSHRIPQRKLGKNISAFFFPKQQTHLLKI